MRDLLSKVNWRALLAAAIIVGVFCVLVLTGCDPAKPTATGGKEPNTKQKIVERHFSNGMHWPSKRDYGTWRSKGPMPRGPGNLANNCHYKIAYKNNKLGRPIKPDKKVSHIKKPFTIKLDSTVFYFRMGGCKDLFFTGR